MNIVVLIGNLVKDIDYRQTKDGVSIGSGSIAVKRDNTKKDEVDYINFSVFGKGAEFLTKYARKGTTICINGSWQHTTFTDKAGNTRSSDKCVANEVRIVSGGKESQREKPQVDNEVADTLTQIDITDDDLPF